MEVFILLERWRGGCSRMEVPIQPISELPELDAQVDLGFYSKTVTTHWGTLIEIAASKYPDQDIEWINHEKTIIRSLMVNTIVYFNYLGEKDGPQQAWEKFKHYNLALRGYIKEIGADKLESLISGISNEVYIALSLSQIELVHVPLQRLYGAWDLAFNFSSDLDLAAEFKTNRKLERGVFEILQPGSNRYSKNSYNKSILRHYISLKQLNELIESANSHTKIPIIILSNPGDSSETRFLCESLIPQQKLEDALNRISKSR